MMTTRRWIRPPGPRHVGPYRASGRAAARQLIADGVAAEEIRDAISGRPLNLDVKRLREAVEAPAAYARRCEEENDFNHGLLDIVAAVGGLHLGRRQVGEFDLDPVERPDDMRASA